MEWLEEQLEQLNYDTFDYRIVVPYVISAIIAEAATC